MMIEKESRFKMKGFYQRKTEFKKTYQEYLYNQIQIIMIRNDHFYFPTVLNRHYFYPFYDIYEIFYQEPFLLLLFK